MEGIKKFLPKLKWNRTYEYLQNTVKEVLINNDTGKIKMF